MERIKALDRYQKGILLLLAAMMVVFSVAYAVVSSRVGFLYLDELLLPREENGNTIYAGTINGQKSSFVVTPEKEVTFHHGSKVYGPYTAKEDPTARPEDEPYLTGVEIRDGDEVFFRGGVYRSSDGLSLYGENGGISFSGFSVASNGIVTDSEGNIVDQMVPAAADILVLMDGPELTSKGEWMAWFFGVFASVITAISILFADELFRWNLAFRISNVESAEPSDWEIGGRYIGWTVMTIMALVIYIMGLQ